MTATRTDRLFGLYNGMKGTFWNTKKYTATGAVLGGTMAFCASPFIRSVVGYQEIMSFIRTFEKSCVESRQECFEYLTKDFLNEMTKLNERASRLGEESTLNLSIALIVGGALLGMLVGVSCGGQHKVEQAKSIPAISPSYFSVDAK